MNSTKKGLNLYSYKLEEVQFLNGFKQTRGDGNMQNLLKQVAAPNLEQILFSYEKIFSVEQLYNHQNDRIWSTTSPGKFSMVNAVKTVIVPWFGQRFVKQQNPSPFLQRKSIKVCAKIRFWRNDTFLVSKTFSQRDLDVSVRFWVFSSSKIHTRRANECQWMSSIFLLYFT